MPERFDRVFSLTPNLYSAGCPIILEAGALQKDIETGNVLAQIKMKNIGKKVISSCKVNLRAFENNGNEIEGVKDFSYLDLNLKPGDEFGGKTPIFLPDATTRSFSVSINEIVYEDNSIISDVFGEWNSIPEQKTVKEYLNKLELVEQYALEVGGSQQYTPILKDGLFICGCGAVNEEDNKKCYKCGKTYDELVKHLNVENLSKTFVKRISAEKAEKEAVAQKKKSRNLKIGKILAVVATIIIVVITVSLLVTKVIIPNNQYNAAVELYEKGEYKKAIESFEKLNGYKDSEDQIQSCIDAINEEKYVKANELFSSGSYKKALDIFESISDYKDSTTKAQQCTDKINKDTYKSALKLLKEKKYKTAKVEFEKISEYSDSDKYITYCEIAESLSGDLEGENLSILMSLINELKNFNNADKLIANNKYLSKIKSWKGSWYNSKGEVDEEGAYFPSYKIDKDGYILIWLGPNRSSAHTWGFFTVKKGKLCPCEQSDDSDDEKSRIGKISVSGNTMTLTDHLLFTEKLIRK